MESPGGFKMGVLIPSQDAGKLIGKAGIGLKQVREMSQCNIRLGQEPDSQGNRRCDISGPTVEHVASAVHAVATRIFADAPLDSAPCKLFVAFPNEYVGQIIGKGAENLKRIREQTGANLTLMKDVMSDQGDRVGQLQGVHNQLGAAVRLALSHVASPAGPAGNTTSAPQNAYYGGAMAQPMQPTQQHMSMPMHNMQPMQTMHQPMSMPMMQSASLAGVKRGSGNASEVQVHMVIPPKFVGAILGKEGAQIKQITTETGCTNVSVTKKEISPERRVVILGGFEECANAQRAVYQLYISAAQSAEEEVKEPNVILMVPQQCAGAVIGKEGANLKQLREQLSLRVSLSRDTVEGFRPCSLAGPLESVLAAEKQIQDQVVQAFQSGEDRNGAKRFVEDGEGMQGLVPEMKRPRMGFMGEVVTKLLVPAATAGAIVGKQGSMLKQIRESTGAHLEVLPQAQAPHFTVERLVQIKGSLEIRQAALVKVLQAAFEKDQLNTFLKLLVASQSVGAIIGRQGSTLKAIRDQCGLPVQVEREEIYGDRLVVAAGPLQSVLGAATLVLQAAESANAGNKAVATVPMGQPMEQPMEVQMGFAAPPPGAYWPQQGME